MLLNIFVGLLGLAGGPFQGLATARAVGDWNPSVSETRNIAARAPDWPKLTLADIGPQAATGMAGIITVEGDKGKEVLDADNVFIKTRGDPAHELEVYADLEGKDFSLEVLAQIVDDNDDVIGFVNPAVERVDARKSDLDACKEILEKFHETGWLHMDPNRGNFFKVDDEWKIIDFSDAKKVDDETAYPDSGDDDDDRREADLNWMGALWEQGRRKH